MRVLTTPVFCLTVLLLPCWTLPLIARAHPPIEGAGIADRGVHGFDVEGLSLLDALLQLGRQARVPLGIEYLDPADLEKSVTLHVSESSVGHVLRAILDQRAGYTWTVDDGVVHIGHAGLLSGGANLLDHVLQKFVIGETELTTAADLMLPGQLKREMSAPRVPSGVSGVYGSAPGGRPEDRVGPLDLENVTVREVLNRLVSARNNAAWVILVPPSRLDRFPSDGLWYIIEYEAPQARWSGVIGSLLRENWAPERTQQPTQK